jgi:ribA/ribD-fused uncharacterized protein
MEFKNDLAFLSNFYLSPILLGSKEYPTVEHAFQSMKTKDPELRELIRNASTPGKAKRLGSNVRLREDWEEKKHLVMYQAVHKKFTSTTELRDKLLKTGDQKLVEGNSWHDNYWGNCGCKKCIGIHGENHLGEILMDIRTFLGE